MVLDADMCRDRWGGSGLPYYANTQIVAGDELFVCYGATYEREYDTICSDSSFEDCETIYRYSLSVSMWRCAAQLVLHARGPGAVPDLLRICIYRLWLGNADDGEQRRTGRGPRRGQVFT